MAFICPLCITELGEEDQLARLCLAHPARTEELSGLDPHVRTCAVPSCRMIATFDTRGVYLAHLGCVTGANPYGDGGPPDGDVIYQRDDDDVAARADPLEGTRIRHYELAVLHRIADQCRKRWPGPEGEPFRRCMWFPVPLLVQRHDVGDRDLPSHVLVAMTGAQGVGKTFLSMHLTDVSAWQDKGCVPHDFLYSFADGAKGLRHEFQRALALRTAMTRGGALEFGSTLRSTMNLRAGIFLRKELGSWVSGEGNAAPRRAHDGRARSGWLRSGLEAVLGEEPGLPGADDYCTLLLYDIPGEDAVLPAGVHVDRYKNAADVFAILVSAPQLCGVREASSGEGDSVSVAVQSLRAMGLWKGEKPGRRVALVVTKVDLLPPPIAARLPGPFQDDGKLARAERISAMTEAQGRATALGLVRELLREGRGRASAFVQLLEKPGAVDAVFFVGRAADHVIGLQELVRWCFARGR